MIRSRRMKLIGHVALMGENRNAYIVEVIGRTARRKKSTGRSRRRWVGNIKMDFGETGWELLTGLVWLRIRTDGELL
jgi:hypothetical protein